jgi:hypothetical protein
MIVHIVSYLSLYHYKYFITIICQVMSDPVRSGVRSGQVSCQARPGQVRAVQGRSGQGRAGVTARQVRSGQGRSGHGTSGQVRAG